MFVHLRLHTEFSVVDGTNRIDEVVKAAVEDQQPALAITDLNNMFAAIKFYKETRGKGLKPLIGAEIIVEGLAGDKNAHCRMLVLVQSWAGYLNLSELLARSWTRNTVKTQAVCKIEWLEELNAGMILLSGAQAGPVGQSLLRYPDGQVSDDIARRLSAMFSGRFYLEIQRAGRVDDEAMTIATVMQAMRLQLPVVATHPVQFPNAEDFDAHEARVCISEGEILNNVNRPKRFTRDQYFKSSAEMSKLFADVPSALVNAVEIAKRCNIVFELDKPQLPNFPTPDNMPIADYFTLASHEGLEQRLSKLYPDVAVRDQQRQRYVDRLDFEIGVILKMGFPGYFLIVGDFIGWAKANGCPVGPGRGSGAGSLVAYSLKITDLDPLEYNLLFERFLNPDRVSMPDFDIDFCQTNRDRVIDYVKDKYGRDAVSQIATFGTMAAKAAIRDVGRVMDMSYMFCDGISKLIPAKPGQHITIAGAIEVEPVLKERYHKEEEVKNLLTLAQKLEGMTRNVGMHAGGVLIAPGKLTDFCPLYQQPGSDSAVSQYDKDDVESIGLVKFDFLGLATLTILEIAKEFIVARHPDQKDFAYEDLSVLDDATYRLFAEGKTEAVFQFESGGMQKMLKEARPTRLEDLIALNALYRPGPMDLIPSFVARKHGREEVEVPHPLVKDMLAETYGIMVYQEQVMQTAQILGGYTLGAADLLRRAMGKKKAEEMAKHREIFRAGAAKNGLDAAKADEVFDLMEKFAGYGFNKSHAAAYSLLAYHTGWLKVHYTAEFYCANMTVEMDDTDKLKVLFDDANKLFGIVFERPDINLGVHRFVPITNQSIRYGLGAIKGTGQSAIEAIVKAREKDGPFLSFYDFCRRIDKRRVNKRTVEALIKAGAFDSIEPNRAKVSASVERGFVYGSAVAANVNQGGLFDMADDGRGASTEEPAMVEATPWTIKERLTLEKAAVGFHLSGHLFDEMGEEVRKFVRQTVGKLVESRELALVAGIITDLRYVNGARGKVAIFKLDDKTGLVDVAVDESVMGQMRGEIKEDEFVVISARIQRDKFSGGFRLSAQQVWDLAGARCRFGKFLCVHVQEHVPDIKKMVKEFPPVKDKNQNGKFTNGLAVRIVLEKQMGTDRVTTEIHLDERAMFYPSNEAIAQWATYAQKRPTAVVYN